MVGVLFPNKRKMKEYTPFEIADLILEKRRGTISVEREEELAEWADHSEHNKQLYGLLSGQELPEDIRYGENDYEIYYKRCCQKIDRSRSLVILKGVKWAALFVLPLAIASLLYFGKGNIDTYISKADIHPGSANAILILSDGEKVSLGDKDLQERVVKDCIKVESDTLKYEKSSSDKIAYNTIIIPRGGEYVLKLSDGTKIWLNAESELKYPVSFTEGERLVYLKGEGFFKVAKNEKSPFKVITDDHIISVLGTEFCIRAYSDEKYITTTLESGMVSIEAGNRHAVLVPGQQSNVSNSELTVTQVNTQLYTAWRNNLYIFDGQPLREILHTLSRWYDMEVKYDSVSLGDICFTGELMKYSDIGNFLEKLENLEKVRFNIKGKTVTVSAY